LDADKEEGIDRVNVTIDHQLQQERTVPSWPSVTTTTTGTNRKRSGYWSTEMDNNVQQADSAIVAIRNGLQEHSQQRQGDHWQQLSLEIRLLVHGNTDSVNVTIGRILNYRSGSAIVATTGTRSKRDMDSAMIVAIQPT
jgi:hypothetical protein